MPVLTDWLRSVADMTKAAGVVLGVRVWPTEAMNLERGLDVRTWVEEGLVDYLLPYVYGGFVTDSQPPIQWLVEAAAESTTRHFLDRACRLANQTCYRFPAEVNVYGCCVPTHDAEPPTSSATMRACAANLWAAGCDGLYTFFAHWPHGDAERAWLGQIGHREQLDEGSKEYRLGEGQLPQPISAAGEKAVVELVSAAKVGLGCDCCRL